MKKSWGFIALSLFASAALIGFVLAQLDTATLSRHVNPAALLSIAPALPLYGLALLFRGIRIASIAHRYQDAQMSGLDGVRIATLLAFANHVLPFRLGEGVFVYLSQTVL
ncbi:MAG: hypothetical protein AAFQ82_26855, partial [Myxococcota bacterium]